MRKRCIIALLAAALVLSGCASSNNFEGRHYEPYGLLSPQAKSPNVCYAVSAVAVIFSIILIETIVFPVYIIGWALFEPVRLKAGPTDDCGSSP